MSVWTLVQWVGALAGIAALTIQGVGAWRSRHDPHDMHGLRAVLDTAYGHVLPIAQGPYGTPSLRMVEGDSWRTMVELPRYSERLADPVLRRAVHDAGLAYHLAFALGSNLDGPRETWPADLVETCALTLGGEAITSARLRTICGSSVRLTRERWA